MNEPVLKELRQYGTWRLIEDYNQSLGKELGRFGSQCCGAKVFWERDRWICKTCRIGTRLVEIAK